MFTKKLKVFIKLNSKSQEKIYVCGLLAGVFAAIIGKFLLLENQTHYGKPGLRISIMTLQSLIQKWIYF
jgi:hypothetical protein